MDSKKLKVALVTSVIDGRKGRGTAGVATEWLSRILKSPDFEFTLIHHESDNNPIYSNFHSLIIPHLPKLFDRQILRELLFWFKLRSQGVHFDVVHYLHPRVWPSYLATSSRKIITTPHDAGVMLKLNGFSFSDLCFMFTNRFLHQRMDTVIAVSNYAKKEICETFKIDPSRVEVVHNSLPQSFTQTIHLQYSTSVFSLPKKYILSVGRFDPHKNIHRLIEAYAIARKNGLTDLLLLVGGGHNVQYTEIIRNKIKELNLSNYIIEAPFIPDNELPEVYKQSQALIYPSLHEGFGLPLLEAMACDIPIAAAGCTSLPEIAADAALFFNPKNCDEMADAIIRITTDTNLRNDLILKGRHRVTDFSWESSIEKIKQIYRI